MDSREIAARTPLEEDFVITAYQAFVRKARQAVHQGLFFLDHLESPSQSTRQPVAEYRPFALRQVRGIVKALEVPTPPGRACGTTASPVHVVAVWERIRRFLESEDLESADIKVLRAEVESFLKASRATGWGRITHMRNSVKCCLGRQVTTLAALALIGFGLFVPEQVRQLLLFGNRLGVGIIPFALIGFGVNIVLGFQIGLLRAGRRAFWRPWNQATEPEGGIARWPDESRLRSQIAFGLLLKVILSAVSQALAFALVFAVPKTMWGSRTAGVIVSLASIVLMLAHVVDRWDFMDDRPTRALTILGAIVCAAIGFAWGGSVVVAYLIAVAIVPLLARALPRKAGDPPRQPRWISWFFLTTTAIVCTLLIWGERTNSSAVWKKTPLPSGSTVARISSAAWPFPGDASEPAVVVAASGGGSRAAIYTAMTLANLSEDVRNHIQAISSVSGGSLTNAAYIQQLRHAHRPLTKDSADEMLANVSDDFLLQTLIGATNPNVGRGGYLEQYWERFLGPEGMDALVTDWQRAVDGKHPLPPFPLPLFNSCTLDGHDLVMSPLAADLYRSVETHPQKARDRFPGQILTNVFDRDGIYAFEDLLGGRDLRLSAAVRASANFPFGFPLMTLETDVGNLWLSAAKSGDKPARVMLTDGGVLSNSGMWPLYRLLMSDPDVVSRLKDRGVLLIVIEASKMPATGQSTQALWTLNGQISDKKPIAQRLHRTWFENLKREYGPLLQIVQVDLKPTDEFNVGTSWALDSKSRGLLDESFRQTARDELASIPNTWRGLKLAAEAHRGGQVLVKEDPVSFERPPVD